MFRKVLIANRGEIACRIARTLKRMGIGSVAVYSEADSHSLHVLECDEALPLGPAAALDGYLRTDKILGAALETGADAIHPGYGFLSENADFAEACAQHGLAFIGPHPDQIRAFGLKHVARDLAKSEGVPLVPGTDLLPDAAAALAAARNIGYPVMLKSTAGGGGIGMRLARDERELREAFEVVERLSHSHFKQGGLYLERYVEAARHIEVQIFGDGLGRVLVLGDRDCSAQRRNQKVIEETPAPGLTDGLRRELHACAQKLGEKVKYASAGTVEFVYDVQASRFYFLEVNTRLQVEHGVTEAVTGVDLVEWMIRQSAGEIGFLPGTAPSIHGHAIEVRLYAEDPAHDFRPSAGRLTQVAFPPGIRCDTWIESGCEVSPHYDPLLAKLIVHAADRSQAVSGLAQALKTTRLDGMVTNLAYLRSVLADPVFATGGMTTRYLGGLDYRPHVIEVLQPGAQTMVQDYPGRVGFWDVGVPPCGPMDPLSFRLANLCVGNSPDTAGLEITASGPSLLFHREAVIAVTGAPLPILLEHGMRRVELAPWTPHTIPAGATVRLGTINTLGMRAYLAVQDGLDLPPYMGSRSTFTLGGFGGHGGRVLRGGDQLPLLPARSAKNNGQTIPLARRPTLTSDWTLRVLYGPHGAPDFFTQVDIDMLWETPWEVHFHSNRTGIRLTGPKPQWARSDGGEAGLHPSNIHDNAYAIGAIDFTGDMPILLGPDGPSLGGFVCPATVVFADLWKLGQLRPGDRVKLLPIGLEEARKLAGLQEELCRGNGDMLFEPLLLANPSATPRAMEPAIILRLDATGNRPEVTYRRSGDRNILVEYGPIVLDLDLRFRVHALMHRIQSAGWEGLLELTPGIRSLQVHFDATLHPDDLLQSLQGFETEWTETADLELPTRILHLPLSWDDEAIHQVIRKYMQVVRADAPWCPSNIEFIRRINGLQDIETVKDIVFNASYLVLGLGDVYLGAPVATPLDPRHRLVTTKYNPARTWTVDNVVGIGGAYMCIYGMEGPGGYQLFGRTCQVWNTWKTTEAFPAGKPWLLRFFDQIRFYPVSHEELQKFRADFLHGKAALRIEENTFSLSQYRAFLSAESESIAAFRHRQRKAFVEERERWQAAGLESAEAAAPVDAREIAGETPPGLAIDSPISGNIWKILAQAGQTVQVGQALLILESMKMEFPVLSPRDGRVGSIAAKEGQIATSGQALLYLLDL